MKTFVSAILAACLLLCGMAIVGPAESGEVSPGMPWLTPRGPIRIDSDADFIPANGVNGGDGSAGNPWIIDGWSIDGTGHGYCIYIGNTTEHFVLRDCYLHNASGGDSIYRYNATVMLYSVSNGTLFNNTASAGWFGIYLYGESHNNTVKGNNITQNQDSGLILDNNPRDNIVLNNTVHGNGLHGIYIYTGRDNMLRNNTVHGNGVHGLYLYTSKSNAVHNCSVHNNSAAGIHIFHNSDNNTVSGNHVADNVIGIRAYNSHGNEIHHNNIIDNTAQGYDDTGTNLWDDGYPSGGNYWSDYTGTDQMNGPGQDIPGADGIGDSPYSNIGGGVGATDRYPLMFPTTEAPEADTVPPHALSWGPVGDGADAGTKLYILWNESMNWASVEDAFNYTDGTTVWTSANGTWYHDLLFNSTFTPHEPFGYEDTYWVTINCTAFDFAGNLLDQDQNGIGGEWPQDMLRWNFTVDDEAPYVVSTQPADGQFDVDPHKPFKAIFSEMMNRTGVAVSFAYTDGNNTWNVTDGAVYWNALHTEFTFSPVQALETNTTFIVTFNGTLATDTGGKGLKYGDHTWTFSTWLEPPAPKVVSTYPPDGAFNVNVNTYINIGFDSEMNTQSAEAAFSYTDGVDVWTVANGTVDWFSDDTLFSFQPAQRLDFDTAYTVRITSEAVSIYGVSLDGNQNGVPEEEDDHVFSFTTTPEPPMVSSHYPGAGQRNIPTNLDAVYINFSKIMNLNSVTNAVSISPSTPFTPVFSGSGRNLTLVLAAELQQGTEYRVTVLGSAMDLSGTRLDGNGDGWPGDRFTFLFYTTGIDTPDTPRIVAIFPPNNSTIPTSAGSFYVAVTFNNVMNRTSAENAFSFRNASGEINGSFTWSSSGKSFRFMPSGGLSPNTTYIASVAGSAKDSDGQSMGNASTWYYITESPTQKGSVMDWVLYGLIIGLLALSTVLYLANRSLRMELKRTRVKLKRLRKQTGIKEEGEMPAEEPAEAEPVPEEEGD